MAKVNFYVYAYLSCNGTPYYIGKGGKRRAWNKQLKYKEVERPSDPSRIVVVERNLTDVGASALERRLIAWYGRLDKGTGILENKTDGGDGSPGVIRSQSHKNAVSSKLKGRQQTWHRTPVEAPDGRVFATLKAAAEEYGLTSEGINYRCKANVKGWRFQNITQGD